MSLSSVIPPACKASDSNYMPWTLTLSGHVVIARPNPNWRGVRGHLDSPLALKSEE